MREIHWWRLGALTLICAILVACCTINAHNQRLDHPQIMWNAMKATHVENTWGGGGVCFPVAVTPTPDGKWLTAFLTARHIQQPTRIWTGWWGDEWAEVIFTVGHMEQDLRVMWTLTEHFIPTTPIAKNSPVFGDWLITIGHANDEWRMTDGRAGRELGIMSANAAFGFSGGPVLNHMGSAVGVSSAVTGWQGRPVWFLSRFEPLTTDEIKQWLRETLSWKNWKEEQDDS